MGERRPDLLAALGLLKKQLRPATRDGDPREDMFVSVPEHLPLNRDPLPHDAARDRKRHGRRPTCPHCGSETITERKACGECGAVLGGQASALTQWVSTNCATVPSSLWQTISRSQSGASAGGPGFGPDSGSGGQQLYDCASCPSK